MALPNGAGGYQIGDGNLSEVTFTNSAIPTAYTTAATLTPADLAGGLVVYNLLTTANNFALPTAAALDAAFSSAKVNSSFDFALAAANTGVPTLTAGTGWTFVGGATVGVGLSQKSVLFRVIKTGDAAYSLYRIAG
jgi:hypothetical protein